MMKFKRNIICLFLLLLTFCSGINSVSPATEEEEEEGYDFGLKEGKEFVFEVKKVNWTLGQDLGLDFNEWDGDNNVQIGMYNSINFGNTELQTQIDEKGAKQKFQVEWVNQTLPVLITGAGFDMNSTTWEIVVDRWSYIDPDWGFNFNPDSEAYNNAGNDQVINNPQAFNVEEGEWNGDKGIYENVTEIPRFVPKPVKDYLAEINFTTENFWASDETTLQGEPAVLKSITVKDNVITKVWLVSTENDGDWINHKEISYEFTYDTDAGIIKKLEISSDEETILLIEMTGLSTTTKIAIGVVAGVLFIGLLIYRKKQYKWPFK